MTYWLRDRFSALLHAIGFWLIRRSVWADPKQYDDSFAYLEEEDGL